MAERQSDDPHAPSGFSFAQTNLSQSRCPIPQVGCGQGPLRAAGPPPEVPKLFRTPGRASSRPDLSPSPSQLGEGRSTSQSVPPRPWRSSPVPTFVSHPDPLVPSRCFRSCRGSLFPLVKKDPHHQQRTFFRPQRGASSPAKAGSITTSVPSRSRCPRPARALGQLLCASTTY
jgi:hypothetical protein